MLRKISLALAIVLLPSNASPQVLPRVYLLATGGTIAGRGTSTTAGSNYERAAVTGSEIVDSVPELRKYAEIRVEQVANVYGNDLTVSDWLRLAKRINTILQDEPTAAGIVVTHGTNTLEETAFFLHLTVRDQRPVVVVGSQRPGTALSADGPANLLGAVRTVISPHAKAKGVLAVMNDEINSARDVAKTNTYRPGTFRTPELGFLGYVDQDKVTFYRDVTRKHTFNSEFDISALDDLPAVEILYSYIQPSVVPFHALVASGVRGIVFAGPGPASLSSFERAAIQKVNEMPPSKRPVLLRASRAGNGRATDAGPEYAKLQTLTADNLSPHKARILLMLALTRTSDLVELRRIFSEY